LTFYVEVLIVREELGLLYFLQGPRKAELDAGGAVGPFDAFVIGEVLCG